MLATGSQMLRLMVIYRPPPSQKNKHTVNNFLQEFESFLCERQLLGGRDIIIGDFNFHVGDSNNIEAKRFMETLESYGYTQHVAESTHKSGHILDLVISRKSDSSLKNIWIHDALISDHSMVHFDIETSISPISDRTVYVRKIRDIDIDAFQRDIEQCDLITKPAPVLEQLAAQYQTCLSGILEKHAPLKKKVVSCRPKVPWYNSDIANARSEKKKAENKWRKTHLTVHREIYREKKNHVISLITMSKKAHYSNLITNNEGNQAALFKTMNQLFNKKKESSLPSNRSDIELSEDFSQFFTSKIENIRKGLHSLQTVTEPVSESRHPNLENELHAFQSVSEDIVEKIINKAPVKSCCQDPIPTTLLKSC